MDQPTITESENQLERRLQKIEFQLRLVFAMSLATVVALLVFAAITITITARRHVTRDDSRPEMRADAPPSTGSDSAAGQAMPSNAPPPSAQDIKERLALAEALLAKGRINDAYEAVNRVLRIDPGNQQAHALREKIMNAERTAVSPLPAPRSAAPALQQQGEKASARDRAAEKRLEASVALNQGNLTRAFVLIEEGRRLDPTDPRWGELLREVEARRRELTTSVADTQKQRQIAALLRVAAESLAAKDFGQAMAHYRMVLELDPQNAMALQGITEVSVRQAQLNRPRSAERIIRQSVTVYVPAVIKADPSGFAVDDKLDRRAAGAPTFPAEIIIELNPHNAQPGQLYEVIVTLVNTGQKTISVKSIEIVQGELPMSQSQPVEPVTRVITGTARGLLYRMNARWTEEQVKGSIRAIVTLVSEDRLIKTISW